MTSGTCRALRVNSKNMFSDRYRNTEQIKDENPIIIPVLRYVLESKMKSARIGFILYSLFFFSCVLVLGNSAFFVNQNRVLRED